MVQSIISKPLILTSFIFFSRATNPFGTTSKSFLVEIASRTKVVVDIEDKEGVDGDDVVEETLHAALGTSFEHECKFSVDERLQSTVKVQWKKDGQGKNLHSVS